jgi:hypothetical protein
MPRVADFRVEWTDGGVDLLGADLDPNTPDDGGTRWFGLRPDPTDLSGAEVDNITSGAPMRHIAVQRQDAFIYIDPTLTPEAQADVQAAEQALNDVYRDKVEWSPDGNAGTTTAAYRAIWRGDTWQYRPKALRISYRLYDDNDRLRQSGETDFNRDGEADSDGVLPKRQVLRAGREFSVVVRVP